jgi:hypothetical protein
VIIYLFIFFVFMAIALLGELNLTRRSRLALFVLGYVLLTLFVGLRWETGNDWVNYYNYYKHLPTISENFASFEPGFKALNLISKNLGLPFWGFNLFYAALYLGLMFLSLKRDNFEVSGWIVLQLYSPFIFGLMGTTRQVMAIAICMFSVRYVLSRRLIPFALCVILATAFHISALAFFLVWPLGPVRLSQVRVWVSFALLVTASLLNVGSAAFDVLQQKVAVLRLVSLQQRLSLEQESNPEEFRNAAGPVATVLQTAGRFSLLALFVLCLRFFRHESDQLYFKLYFVSIIIIVLLSGTAYVLAGRVALYFAIFQIHLLALLTRRIPAPWLRSLCCIALIALSLTRLWTATHLIRPQIFVPYKGVFINQDVKRDPGWF